MITVDPKFPNSIVAAIVSDPDNLPTYALRRMQVLQVDRNGRLLASISGAVTATVGTSISFADNVVLTTGSLVAAQGYLFDGTNYDRARSVSAATQGGAAAATPVVGIQAMARVGNWTLTSNPGAGVQATVTRAGVGGVRHICTGMHFSAVNADINNNATLTVVLRDGASGVGAILWQENFLIPALSSGNMPINIPDLCIVGTAGNAMTLEFTASAANVSESVNLTGYSTN